ncbi:MAG: hypothetical protein S4CHLAM7_04460 [Chlamydiae bacterium]|nr:hypothetical protein [Chlamydiota bacterium]
MFKCSHFILIVLSGLVWTVIGVMLMTLGMHHMMDTLRFWDEIVISPSFSLFKSLALVFPRPEQAMAALIIGCILIGYVKGHFVLNKSVRSGVQKILGYPNPAELKNLYTRKYYVLLLFMMCLGFFIRWLKLPGDIHGAIDLAIGSALLKGAFSYFKYAWAEKRGVLAQDK